jgi:hypothetical protein
MHHKVDKEKKNKEEGKNNLIKTVFPYCSQPSAGSVLKLKTSAPRMSQCVISSGLSHTSRGGAGIRISRRKPKKLGEKPFRVRLRPLRISQEVARD